MIDYLAEAERANPRGKRESIIERLNAVLPGYWINDYVSAPGSHRPLLVTPSGSPRAGAFISYAFDLVSDTIDTSRMSKEALRGVTHDRVIACWGVTRAEPGASRDKSRIAGFLKGVWSQQYKGRDRGHLFAHTMGGGMDINLVPQLSKMNRDASGAWRAFEQAAASNPGSFAFIRPIYEDNTWIPARLEYGLFYLPPVHELTFKGGMVEN